MQEDFWEAHYTDGTMLRQYDDGVVHKYTDIDRKRLSRFMYFLRGTPRVILNLDQNKRLVYRARRSMNAMTGELLGTVHIIGYQETVGGVNRQVLCFLGEDGIVEVRDGFSNEHALYNSVEFLPEEQL